MHDDSTLFITALLFFVAFSYLGYWLSARQPKLGKWLLTAIAVLGTVCSALAYWVTQGPSSTAQNVLVDPSQPLWFGLLALVISTTSYFLGRLVKQQSLGAFFVVTGLNLLCAVLYLPLIGLGLFIHTNQTIVRF